MKEERAKSTVRPDEIKRLLNAIINRCDRLTVGNLAHHRNAIRTNARFAIIEIERGDEGVPSECNTGLIGGVKSLVGGPQNAEPESDQNKVI